MEGHIYSRLGTLTSYPAVQTWVGRRDGEEALLLVNQIVHSKKSKALFRDLYHFSRVRPEHSDFMELFNDGQSFCAVFSYHEAPSLAERYPDGEGAPARKLKLLSDALLRVNAALSMPLPVVLSVLQPENILLDEEDAVFLRYRLLPEYLDVTDGGLLWDCLDGLLAYLFPKELHSFRFRALQSIRAKCRAKLYGSLSEMIKDLEKAADHMADTGLIYILKQKFLRVKAQLGKAAGLGTAVLAVCLVIYLVNSLAGPEALPAAAMTDIGRITYAADGGEEKELALSDSEPSQPDGRTPDYSSIAPDTPLEFEDYVVRPRDTLDTVCRLKYGSAGYKTPVCLFNGISEDSALTAGSILRLPLKSRLAAYEE